jgi:chromosome segregation ATPase
MSRALTWINLLGVLVLAALCALQWRTNRALNLDVNSLEQTRLEQTARLSEQDKTLRGLQADLERFREQLGSTTLSQKDAETKLRASERLAAQLSSERDQLKASIAEWTAAVAARDSRLADANTLITDLSAQLNDTVAKYNALVSSHNDLVKQLDAARAAGAPAPKEEDGPPGPSP